MKVIVAKKNHPQYIGLSSTGQFIKFRHKTGLQIGEMADVKPATINIAPRWVAGIAAATLLMSASVFGYAYSIPANYLYVDINPSIELAVNCFDLVISAKGLNADGETVIAETSLNNNSTEKSLEKILEKAVEKGYMGENLENVVLLNTSGNEKVLAKIKEKVNNYTNNGGLMTIKPQMQIESVDNAHVQEAQKQHISAGRLKLIEKAITNNPELSNEKLKDMSVRDIIKQIKAERLEEKAAELKIKPQTQAVKKEENGDAPAKPNAKKHSINQANSQTETIQNDNNTTPTVEEKLSPQSKHIKPRISPNAKAPEKHLETENPKIND